MKNSVLAALMLLMVLSFGLNAFSAVSEDAVNKRLQKLITSIYPAGMILEGTTESGSWCEIGIGAGNTGIVGIMVSKRTMMGTAHYSLSTNGGSTITSAKENASQLEFVTVNGEYQETWTIGLNADKSMKSIQITEESDGFFGRKSKSVINCSL